jgi:hypothetical protein
LARIQLWFDAAAAKKALRAVPFVTDRWPAVTIVPADVAQGLRLNVHTQFSG